MNDPGPVRILLKAAGAVVLLTVLAFGAWWGWSRMDHGATDYPETLTLTTAPGIQVQALPSHPKLRNMTVEEFDVAANGAVVVRCSGRLHDLATGNPLVEEEVISFAFVREALAVSTADGRLGYWGEDGITEICRLPFPNMRLKAGADRQRLLIFGGEPMSRLIVVEAGRAPRLLSGSPETINAAAAGSAEYFSTGRAVFTLVADEHPRLLFMLPEAKGDILGMACAGNTLYLSTGQAVYALKGSILLPLVIGLGGPLVAADGALMVLDQASHRIYRIATNTDPHR